MIFLWIKHTHIFQEVKKDYNDNKNKLQENGPYGAQYRELIALINYQREKLNNQQADLTKVKSFSRNRGTNLSRLLFF